MQLAIFEGPKADPLYLDEVKDHLKLVDMTEDDALIDGLIKAATHLAEGELRRKLVTQDWDMRLDGFPCGKAIRLPFPVQSVSEIQYIDQNDQVQILDSSAYIVDVGGIVQFVTPVGSWPATALRRQAVKIRMRAGYGKPESVPACIKAWMLLHVGSWYVNRGTVNVGGTVTNLQYVDGLLDPERVPLVA